MTGRRQPGAPQISRTLLLRALQDRGLSKRGFARVLMEEAGDGNDLQGWERRVYSWTSEEKPTGMSEENEDLVVRALGLPDDYFRLDVLLAQRQEQDELLAEAIRRIEQLENAQSGRDEQLQRIEQTLEHLSGG